MNKPDRKNKISGVISYILLAVLCGFAVGCLIFVFKLAAGAVITLSDRLYAFVRTEPVYLPLLMAGAALLGCVASFVLKYSPDGKGGGIPTAIAVLRGLITFSWVKSLFSVFGSALMTYLCAVPLGNEGPSVLMGTAVGRGCVRVLARNHEAWDRYIMTGGACAGFAAATGAPLTGILFAFEEAHRRFSPLIFTVSSITAVCAGATTRTLCELTGTEYSLFSFKVDTVLAHSYLWVALIIGVVCGISAHFFTRAYRFFRNVINGRLAGVPLAAKMAVVFFAVSLLGFVSGEFRGSGHNIVDELIEGQGAWYILIAVLAVRALLLIVSNNVGVTGGLFVPTLALGAILGSLCAIPLIALGLLPAQYYSLCVIIGISSILGSLSRTPLMAIAFSLECLCGLSNTLPVVLGVSVSYLVVEMMGTSSFTDVVIEGKVEDAIEGRESIVVDTQLTVEAGAFIIGREIRDILWPPSCVVLSVHKNPCITARDGSSICEGDVLDVHYRTCFPEETERVLEAYAGKQKKTRQTDVQKGSDNDTVPEL